MREIGSPEPNETDYPDTTQMLERLDHNYIEGDFRQTFASVDVNNPREEPTLIIRAEQCVYKPLHKDQEVIMRAIDPETYAGYQTALAMLEKRAISLAQGVGIERLEQPLAVSFEDAVIFSTYLPGKELFEFQQQDFNGLTFDQMKDVVPAIEAGCARLLSFDMSSGNIFYDKEKGFSFTDFSFEPELRNTPEGYFADFLLTLAENQLIRSTESTSLQWQSSFAKDVRATFLDVYPHASDLYDRLQADRT